LPLTFSRRLLGPACGRGRFPNEDQNEPLPTFADIKAITEHKGPDDARKDALGESLYLTRAGMLEFLEHVRPSEGLERSGRTLGAHPRHAHPIHLAVVRRQVEQQRRRFLQPRRLTGELYSNLYLSAPAAMTGRGHHPSHTCFTRGTIFSIASRSTSM
jgi:hypothetical protein